MSNKYVANEGTCRLMKWWPTYSITILIKLQGVARTCKKGPNLFLRGETVMENCLKANIGLSEGKIFSFRCSLETWSQRRGAHTTPPEWVWYLRGHKQHPQGNGRIMHYMVHTLIWPWGAEGKTHFLVPREMMGLAVHGHMLDDWVSGILPYSVFP